MESAVVMTLNGGTVTSIAKNTHSVIVQNLGNCIIVANGELDESGEPYIPWVQDYSQMSSDWVQERYDITVMRMLREPESSHYYTKECENPRVLEKVKAMPDYNRYRSLTIEAIASADLAASEEVEKLCDEGGLLLAELLEGAFDA